MGEKPYVCVMTCVCRECSECFCTSDYLKSCHVVHSDVKQFCSGLYVKGFRCWSLMCISISITPISRSIHRYMFVSHATVFTDTWNFVAQNSQNTFSDKWPSLSHSALLEGYLATSGMVICVHSFDHLFGIKSELITAESCSFQVAHWH